MAVLFRVILPECYSVMLLQTIILYEIRLISVINISFVSITQNGVQYNPNKYILVNFHLKITCDLLLPHLLWLGQPKV